MTRPRDGHDDERSSPGCAGRSSASALSIFIAINPGTFLPLLTSDRPLAAGRNRNHAARSHARECQRYTVENLVHAAPRQISHELEPELEGRANSEVREAKTRIGINWTCLLERDGRRPSARRPHSIATGAA
jgi:hypothetical protein